MLYQKKWGITKIRQLCGYLCFFSHDISYMISINTYGLQQREMWLQWNWQKKYRNWNFIYDFLAKSSSVPIFTLFKNPFQTLLWRIYQFFSFFPFLWIWDMMQIGHNFEFAYKPKALNQKKPQETKHVKIDAIFCFQQLPQKFFPSFWWYLFCVPFWWLTDFGDLRSRAWLARHRFVVQLTQ